MPEIAEPLLDLHLEDAERAYERMKPRIDGLEARELSPLNVDTVEAASVALGNVPKILAFREQLAALPQFDMRCVDELADRAKVAWFLHVTTWPAAEPRDEALVEARGLRTKLLRWAQPLTDEGIFAAAAVATIRDGQGLKDVAGDLVALASLFRSRWADVKNKCAVTEDELSRATALGSEVFVRVSRRARRAQRSEGRERVQRAFTLLDRAYTECRRGLTFIRFYAGDVDSIAPSLRRNAGPRGKRLRSAS